MRYGFIALLLLTSVCLQAATPAETAAAARAALDNYDFDKAEALYEKAIAAEPNNAQYHFLLGMAYQKQAANGSMFSAAPLAKKSSEELQKAVALDPNHLDARLALVDFYLMAPGFMGGSEDKAAEQAVDLQKRDPLAGHRAQARIYARQKKMDLARKEYVDAVREQPKSAKAHYYLANFLMTTDKNWAGAQHELEMAIQLDSNYMPPLYRMGQLAVRSESNYARGEEALRKYLIHRPGDNEPDHANTWYWIGQIQEKLGKKAEAKKSYENGLKLAPASKEIKAALDKLS